MSALNLVSLAGVVALAFGAWVAGGLQRPVPWRTVIGSGALMLAGGLLVFRVAPMRSVLRLVNDAVVGVLSASRRGAVFLFGPLAVGPGESTPAGEPSVGFVLAAQVLPAVVFFAALMAVAYHLRLIQPIVRMLGRVMFRAAGLSGAESLAGGSNVFVGIESAAAIKPFLAAMTRSELLSVMTFGMSTVASTTMALYVAFLGDSVPGIAGHLVSASLLMLPAAAITSKLMLPERDRPETAGVLPHAVAPSPHDGALAALMGGAWDGVRLAAGIAATLVAVLGVVGLIDLVLGGAGRSLGLAEPLDLSRILGWVFTPIAWLLGITPADVPRAAAILGRRFVMTEVVAYRDLGALVAAGAVAPRTGLVLSYALCGFAHVPSMAIFAGGIAALAPERRGDLAAVAPRALLAATLATAMTGALAGALATAGGGVLAR